MSHSHPPIDQLAKLATGALANPPAHEVESHVLECLECQKATAELRLGDTFIDDIRRVVRDRDENLNRLESGDRERVERIIDERITKP